MCGGRRERPLGTREARVCPYRHLVMPYCTCRAVAARTCNRSQREFVPRPALALRTRANARREQVAVRVEDQGRRGTLQQDETNVMYL
jgi:hypothetical protein